MSKPYIINLYDSRTGTRISASGGVIKVVTSGAYDAVALTDASGGGIANPLALSSGRAEFWTDNAITTVDVYGIAPGGQAFSATIDTGYDIVILIDTSQSYQVLKIPFDIDDSSTSDNTEEDTGFDEPASGTALFLADPFIVIGTADTSQVIDVGTDSTDSGDADGFMDGVALDTAGIIQGAAAVTVGGNETYFSSCTIGGLLVDFLAGTNLGQDVGTFNPKKHISGGKSITFTLDSGTDTAAGLICLPYLLQA